MKPIILGGPPKLRNYCRTTTDELMKFTGLNTGNLAFRYAIWNHLNRKAKIVPWDTSTDKINSFGDIAVIPCANHLGPHSDFKGRAVILSRLKIPVLSVGLGAQSHSADNIPIIPDGTIRWVKEIANHRASNVPNICVRGEFTRKVLEHYGIKDEVAVLGCPSLFINPDLNLGKTIADRLKNIPKRVAVAAGNPVRIPIPGIEQHLFALAVASGGSYIVQHPQAMVHAARGEYNKLSTEWKNKIDDFLGFNSTNSSIKALSSASMNVFFDIDAWMEQLQRHDFVVGLRIHGIILAIQAGVPALCLTHDSRTEELCKIMHIPHISVKKISAKISTQELYKFINFDSIAFDSNRKKLAKNYYDVLIGNKLEVSKELSQLANIKSV